MRIAIVSDIHGNLTAFEAVLADLRHTSPDLILHGGDLAHGGSSPAEVVDRIRDLAWRGVVGNADELLFRPQSFTEFAAGIPAMSALVPAIEDMARHAREALGEARLEWLRGLPMTQVYGPITLVHASPGSAWHGPAANASSADLREAYEAIETTTVVYGHIHHPYVRRLPGLTVANSGSVSLSYDGDPRASYLLLDDAMPSIRRVEYDIEAEVAALVERAVPHAAWTAKMLRSARPQLP